MGIQLIRLQSQRNFCFRSNCKGYGIRRSIYENGRKRDRLLRYRFESLFVLNCEAEAYGWGKSEELLGAFTKKWISQHPSKKVIIASKFVPMPHRLTKGSFVSALKASLKRLQVRFQFS